MNLARKRLLRRLTLTRFWLRTLTHVNFNHVNKIEAIARSKVLSLNEQSSEVQLLCLRETFHALPLFHLRTQNFTHARTHVKITRHWKSTLSQLKLLTQYSSFKFTVMEKGKKSGKTLDCEQSLFFFRFSKGSARASVERRSR